MKYEQDFLEDYSDEALLEEIRRVAALVPPKETLTVKFFDRNARVHSNTIRRRFGKGWGDLLEMAGVDTGIHPLRSLASPDSEQCLSAIRDVAGELGRPPTRQEYRTRRRYPAVDTIAARFGGWGAALEVAGLPSAPRQGARTRTECLENLRTVFSAIGVLPTYEDLSVAPSRIGPKAYERIWGSYSAAKVDFVDWMADQAISIELPQSTRTRCLDDDEMLERLRNVSDVVGSRHVTQAQVRELTGLDPRAIARRLGGGSWEGALDKAGLCVTAQFHPRRTDEEYFENLATVWEAVGRRPRVSDMKAPPSSLSPEAYVNRFGTFRKAVVVFLDWVNSSNTEDAAAVSATPSFGIRPHIAVSSSERPDTSEPDYSVKGRCPTPKLRFLVMRRDGFACVYCGRRASDGVQLHVDHKRAWASGGATALSNLQTTCSTCNLGKGVLSETI